MKTVWKAIECYILVIVPYNLKRGHDYTWAGMLKGMEMCHHAYIFELYLHNPCLPIYGYCEEFELKFRLHVSNSIIQTGS